MADVVLVACGGGHLEQLHLLQDRIPIDGHRRWVTNDTSQSRSILAGEDVHFVPYVGPRDYMGLMRNMPYAVRHLRPRTTAAVVSTGSGLAIAHLTTSALRGIPTYYIESATRADGPSYTGKMLAKVPGVQLFTQHEHWAGGKWHYGGSVFEGFEGTARSSPRPYSGIRRIVVSLGTIRTYEFRRLVEQVLKIAPVDAKITWQTGYTHVADLPIDARPEIPHHELLDEMRAADVVVAHAGTGIALSAFQAGICPVLVPREAASHEHVDDHQAQTARVLSSAGLVVARRVHELSGDDLARAASRAVVQRLRARPLVLDDRLVPASGTTDPVPLRLPKRRVEAS